MERKGCGGALISSLELAKKTRAWEVMRLYVPESARDSVRNHVYGAPEFPMQEPTTTEASETVVTWIADDYPQWRSLSGLDGELQDVASVVRHLDSMDQPRFLDIGANAGLYTLFATKHAIHIDAVEPLPANIAVLKRNAELNNARNVTVHPVALGDTDREVSFFVGGSSMMGQVVNGHESPDTIPVQMRTIDSMVAAGDIQMPCGVKIDVEGAEGRVLAGAKNTFSGEKRPKLIFVEIHPQYVGQYGDTPETVHSLLHEYGYRLEAQQAKDQTGVHMCHFVRCDQ